MIPLSDLKLLFPWIGWVCSFCSFGLSGLRLLPLWIGWACGYCSFGLSGVRLLLLWIGWACGYCSFGSAVSLMCVSISVLHRPPAPHASISGGVGHCLPCASSPLTPPRPSPPPRPSAFLEQNSVSNYNSET